MRGLRPLAPALVAALLGSSPAAASEVWVADCGELGGWQFGLLQEVVTEPALEPTQASRLVRVSRRVTDVVTGEQVVWTRAGEPGLVLCGGDVVETWYDAQAVINRTSPSADLPIGLIYPEGGSTLYLDARIRQVRGAASYFLFDERPREESFDLEVFIEQSGVVLSRARSLFRVEVVDEDSGQVRVAVSNHDLDVAASSVEHGVMLSRGEAGGRSDERWVAGGMVELALPIAAPEPVAADLVQRDLARLEVTAARVAGALEGLGGPPPTEAYTPPGDAVKLRIPGSERPGALRVDGSPLPAARWKRIDDDGEPGWELRQPLELPRGRHWITLGVSGPPLPLLVPGPGVVTPAAPGGAPLGALPHPVSLAGDAQTPTGEGLWLPIWVSAGVGGGSDGAGQLRLDVGLSLPWGLRVGGLLARSAGHMDVSTEDYIDGLQLSEEVQCEAVDLQLGLWLEPRPGLRHRIVNRPYPGLLWGLSHRTFLFRGQRIEPEEAFLELWSLELRFPIQPFIRLPVPVLRQLVVEPYMMGSLVPWEINFVDRDTGQLLGGTMMAAVGSGLAVGFGSPNRAYRSRRLRRAAP